MAPTSDLHTTTRWVALAPGKGTALVGPQVVALLAARPDEAVVEELWAEICDGGPFDEALAALGAHGFARLPDLVLAGRDDGMTRVVVRGDVLVEVRAADGTSTSELAGGAVHSWAEHLAPPDVGLRLRLGPEVDGREPPGPFVIERGLVPAEAVDIPAGAGGRPPRSAAPVLEEPDRAAPEVAAAPGVVAAPEGVAEPGFGEPEAILVPPTVSTDPVAGPPPAPMLVVPGLDDEEADHRYDHMWGATEARSVEDAARRADEAGGPPPAPGEDLPTRDIGLPDADHDGHTIMADELRRLLGTARTSTAGTVGAGVADGGTYLAVRCSGGHLNPVHGLRCRACDQPLADDAPEVVDQPVLGRLRFSTGTVVEVDRPMLIGRSPKLAGEVRGVIPELVTVPSPEHDISRTHLEVRVEGWQVLLLDRGSTNGTTVALPGREPQRLRPDHPFPLSLGAVVSLADEVDFTFEVDR